MSAFAGTSPLERRLDFDAYIVALAVNRCGSHVAAALGDGTVRLLALAEPDSPPVTLPVHDGTCLALVPDFDEAGFLTGGDDGRLCRVQADAPPATLAEAPGRWIEHVDAHPATRRRAYAAGRDVRLLDAGGAILSDPLAHPSTVGGLAFDPRGRRLAAAHYGGASLWWADTPDKPTVLPWKGSHLGMLWHPDGKSLIATTQESGLHGWRLKDKADMVMGGYPTKIRSLGWTAHGRYLATSGAEVVVCWPFFGGGPWGKQPLELHGSGEPVFTTVVAPHPSEPLIAAGYEDGRLLILPLDGTTPLLVAAATRSPVSAVAWSPNGRHLLFGNEAGRLSWFPIPGGAPLARKRA